MPPSNSRRASASSTGVAQPTGLYQLGARDAEARGDGVHPVVVAATPAAIAVGAGSGAELGVLFRAATALEHVGSVDTVFFDKTGTLTNGRPAVVAIEPQAGIEAKERLGSAASTEVGSEHPFARALVTAARSSVWS